MRDHTPLDLERFLPYRLSLLSNRMSQAIAADYQQQYALSMTEWRVLAVLARFHGKAVSATDIAAYTAMDKVAVSRALAGLVAAGRVTRRRDAADRRRAVLELTADGWKIHDSVAPRARAHETSLLGVLSAGEQRVLARALDKLTAAVTGNASAVVGDPAGALNARRASGD